MADIEIVGAIIRSGAMKIIKMPIDRLASGNEMHLEAHIYNAYKPGPVVLFLAGVHGNEINGIEIVRSLIDGGYLEKLNMGTVIAIPLLNVFGFINLDRDVPDGKDVNRSFPGSSFGSLASRIASKLTNNILPFVDYIVDFHTGGGMRFNYPQTRFTKGDDASYQMSLAFGAPAIIEKPLIAKSLRKIAFEKKIPTIVFEGGESLRQDKYSINVGFNGAIRVLKFLKMIDTSIPYESQLHLCTKTTWLRAKSPGIFTWLVGSGSSIKKNELIAQIKNPYGKKIVEIKAKKNLFIVGHNNSSVVNSGDPLFHVADFRIIDTLL